MDQLARYALIAGGVLIMLSAALLTGAGLMKSHYKLENDKVFEALGRTFSGTNEKARKRIARMRATGYWALGIGVVAMGVGGVFYVYGTKK
jgi:hypothetical protein